MINYDDSDPSLAVFYNLKTVNPQSLGDISLAQVDPIEIDDIKDLSTDQKFDLLNKLVQSNKPSDYEFQDIDSLDPLRGPGTNIIKELIDRQVFSNKNDPGMNQYLISSREFNSQKFLTTVHADSSIDDLISYLSFLENTIQGQQSQLKNVIDENFSKFVDCKNSIDDVLLTFKRLKTRAQQELDKSKAFNPSRQRNMSQDNRFLISDLEDAIKNLTLETSMLIRPIMENKTKETKINKLVDFINTNKFLVDLPSNLISNVSNQNYDQILEDYNHYSRVRNNLIQEQESKLNALQNNESLLQSYQQETQLVNTFLSRIYREVDTIIEEYRKEIYNQLVSLDHDIIDGNKPQRLTNNRFLTLVDQIDRLNNHDKTKSTSPIYNFLKVQLVNAQHDFDYQFNKFSDKFQTMQRKLYDYTMSLHEHREGGSYVRYIADKYRNIEDYYNASSIKPSVDEQEKIIFELFDSSENLDLSLINETWLVLFNFINYLQDVFLKNVSKFANNYSYYVKNNKDTDVHGEIKDEYLSLLMYCSETLNTIFNISDDKINTIDSSPTNYTTFLPYYTNSLSTIFYISKISKRVNSIMTTIGQNVTTIGNLDKNPETNKLIKTLRSTSTSINFKIVEATCSVWINDCSQFYDLENWEINQELFDPSPSEESASFTKLMNIIQFFSIYMLEKLAQLIFIKLPEEKNDDYVKIVSNYPSKKMLVSIEIQFIRTLGVLNDAIIKRYHVETQEEFERNIKSNETYKVLTMNNFDRISRVIYPDLIAKLDHRFDKDIGKQNLKVFADIDKSSLTVLDDILSNEKALIDEILSKFFRKINDGNFKREIRIDNFIYEVLIHFVKLVYNIKPFTNKKIFINIISELQSYFLKTYLDDLREAKTTVPDFNIILINLKLDINFFIEIFESSKTVRLNDYTFNIAEIILQQIKDMESNYDQESIISSKQFDRLLIKSLRDSESQFDCLSR